MRSSQFNNIPSTFDIPYLEQENDLSKKISSSSQKRNISPVKFIFRKMRNILLNRFALFCPLNGWRIKMHRWRGVNIGKNVYIGIQCEIEGAYPEYVFIEDNVTIAGGTTIIAHSIPNPHFKGIFSSKVDPVLIKDGAWIGVKSIILSGVTVGQKAVVSAGAVVKKNVSDFTVVEGNPAVEVANFERIFKKINKT